MAGTKSHDRKKVNSLERLHKAFCRVRKLGNLNKTCLKNAEFTVKGGDVDSLRN